MIALLRAMALTGGEWVIWLLIACSVAAVAVIIDRCLILSRERKEMPRVRDLFSKLVEQPSSGAGELSGLSGLPARVLSVGLDHRAHGADAIEERMAGATVSERQRLERRMILLGTLGNNAVYIGLFGTVLGVIRAFHDLASQSGAGPEVVMQGLSEALIATAVGLLVALPCVVAYNILQKQIKDLLNETEAMARLLLAKTKSRA
jgi:biopolymer transport protein ExbB